MYCRKCCVTILSLLFVAVMVGSSCAQTKTVIIPLSSSKPAVVTYLEKGDVNLNKTDTTVITVTLEAPGKGLVIVNVSGNTYLASATDAYVMCGLTQGTALPPQAMSDGYVTEIYFWNPWGMTRAFPVDSGSQTFNLVCKYGGTASSHAIQDPVMNAVFHSVPSISMVPALSGSVPQASISGCDDSKPGCN